MPTRVVYGINAVAAILQRQPDRIRKIVLLDGMGKKRRRRLDELIERHGPTIELADANALERLTGSDKHQGAAAIVTFHLGDEAPRSRRTLIFVREGEAWRIAHLHASRPPI